MTGTETERRNSSPRIKYFFQLVEPGTLIDAGFNCYGESSTAYRDSEDKLVNVFLGHINHGTETNIVVLQRIRQDADGRHADWYIGTFPGKDISESQTQSETREFFDRVERTLSKENRVKGSELEPKIKEIIEASTTRIHSTAIAH